MIESGDDPGTGAETDNRDLPRGVTTKALIFSVNALANGTTGPTRVNHAAQVDQYRIGAVESGRISEIDGEDLDAFNVLNGNYAFYETSTTNNEVIAQGSTYGLDPFMLGPDPDFNQSFGITSTVARKVEFAYAADGNTIDTKQLAIGVIAKDSEQASSNGYVTFSRDSYTATNNVKNYTTIPQPGNLLGVFGFETNNTADAQTVQRTANDIQQVSLTVDRKQLLGPLYPDIIKSIQGGYEIGALTDEGYFFWNLGIRNEVGSIGRGPIPDKLEIEVLGGSDAGAVRVHAVRLNTNV